MRDTQRGKVDQIVKAGASYADYLRTMLLSLGHWFHFGVRSCLADFGCGQGSGFFRLLTSLALLEFIAVSSSSEKLRLSGFSCILVRKNPCA